MQIYAFYTDIQKIVINTQNKFGIVKINSYLCIVIKYARYERSSVNRVYGCKGFKGNPKRAGRENVAGARSPTYEKRAGARSPTCLFLKKGGG